MTAVAFTNTFAVLNPATGEVITEVPRHGVAETRRAIAAASARSRVAVRGPQRSER